MPTASDQFRHACQQFQSGDLRKTLNLCDAFLSQHPGSPEFLNLKAMTLMGLGQPEQAMETMGQTLKLSRPTPGLQLNAARIHLDCCDFKGARRLARQAAQGGQEQPQVMVQCALVLRDAGAAESAMRVLERSLRTHPENPEAHWLRGSLATDAGNFTQARTSFNEVLKIDPLHARALSELQRLPDEPEKTASLLSSALEQAAQQGKTAVDRATACYALGRINHAAGNENTAFHFFTLANRSANGPAFDPHAWEIRMDKVEAHLQSLDAIPVQGPGDDLVFITGLPRSGTSLCEQILGAHPAVNTAGELPTLHYLEHRLARDGVSPWEGERTSTQLRDIRNRYQATLPGPVTGQQHTTDKAPMNIERLGLIASWFPGAKIIVCTRHPLDNLLSLWFQDFQSRLPWTREFQHIIQVQIRLQRLAELAESVLGSRLLRLPYESVVSEPEAASRQLAAHLGIPWDPMMAKPQDRQSRVSTASNVQVREPVHTRSVGYWQRYEPHLESLKEPLKSAGLI